MKKNSSEDNQKYDRTIAKGALLNALGILGKAMIPVFFIVTSRLYGTELMGVFYLAFTMIEISLSLVSSGFNDGTMMFASRYTDNKRKQDCLYQSLANGFVISLIISVVLVAFSYVGGPELILAKYSQKYLVETVRTMAHAIPFVVVAKLIIDATKAHMTMKWDALLQGFVRPTLLTALAVSFYFLDLGLPGLVWAYVISQLTVAFIALWIFPKYFSYKTLFHHIVHFKLFGPLIKFAIPQNLNMTFNTLITNMDVLMLGYFGYPESDLLLYGMGAQLVRNIRQVKLALSGSFAPLIAKLHEKNDLAGMSDTFSMITRWIISMGLPIAVIVALLRVDLLRLFESDFSGDTWFMLLLLVPPLLSCGFGLAGNIIVMTGHSKWNLFNSLTVAFVNMGLNYFLIPVYGVMGAAAATVIASFIISMMQLVECNWLVGAKLIFKQVYKPYLAILPAVALAAAYGIWGHEIDTLIMRIVTAVLCVAVYIVSIAVLGIDQRDKRALIPWYRPAQGAAK